MSLECSRPRRTTHVDRFRRRLLSRILSVGTLAGAVSAALPAASAAAPFSIEYSANLFGAVDQHKLSVCKDANGESLACGPAATVNGLVFLETWGAVAEPRSTLFWLARRSGLKSMRQA
jgi:hypothetical protein